MSSVGQINKLNYNFAQEKDRGTEIAPREPHPGTSDVSAGRCPRSADSTPSDPYSHQCHQPPQNCTAPVTERWPAFREKKDDTIGKVCVYTIRTLSYCLLSVHLPLLMSVSRSISPEAASPAPTLSVPSPSRFLSGAHQVTDGLSRIAESDDHLLLRL